MDNIPTWLAITIAVSAALFCAILVQLVVVPWQKKKILNGANGEVKFTFGDSDGEDRNCNLKLKFAFYNFGHESLFSSKLQTLLPTVVQNGLRSQFQLFSITICFRP